MRFMFWGLARTAGLSASLVTAILVWPCSGYAAYWNVFNLEGESSISAEFVTYATLSDMLHDTNRTGDVAPSQPFVDANIVDLGFGWENLLECTRRWNSRPRGGGIGPLRGGGVKAGHLRSCPFRGPKRMAGGVSSGGLWGGSPVCAG